MQQKIFTKKTTAIFCACLLFVIGIAVIISKPALSVQLIRIHIRANSNSTQDQAIKLKVRDAIVDYLTVELNGIDKRERAYSKLKELQDNIKLKAIDTLRNNGFYYGANIRIDNEYFPTRDYEGIIVDSGYYDAVIVELGDGTGDNWWCVIYPPLCFLGQGGSIWEYRSKLQELWNAWIKNRH